MSLFLKTDRTDRYRRPEGFLVQFSFLDRLPIGPVSNRLNQWPGRAGRFFKNQTDQLHHFIFFLASPHFPWPNVHSYDESSWQNCQLYNEPYGPTQQPIYLQGMERLSWSTLLQSPLRWNLIRNNYIGSFKK